MNNGGDLENRMKVAETLIEALFESHEKTESELRTLAKSQVLMSEAMERMSEAAKRADERIVEVGDKLDALINLMDQHLRDHREGRA
ncbi:MAG: hypothetical protein ACRD7E_01520 [Bryobacteraceae bacterium]